MFMKSSENDINLIMKNLGKDLYENHSKAIIHMKPQ